MKNTKVKILSMALFMVIIGTVFCGCGSKDNALKKVIENNMKAVQNENIDDYMATLDETSPMYGKTKQLMGQIFKLYDLKYDMKDFKVIENKKDTAKVRVTQITKKIKGPQYKDNEMTVIHTLKKVKGEWKFYSTQIEDIKMLNS